MEPRYESLIKLFENEGVARRLVALRPEEVATVLKEEYNLDFTAEELRDVATGINAALKEDAAGDLTSEQLESVIGGAKGSTAYNAGYYIGKGVKIVGTAAGIAKVAIAIGLISW